MPRFQNQHVIITGGSSGIGAACALMFAKEGAHVWILGRDQGRMGAIKKKILEENGVCSTVNCDVSKEEDILNFFNQFDTAGAVPQVLVTCAGSFESELVTSTTSTQWDQVFNVNVRGTFLCCREAIKRMPDDKPSAIVTVASLAGVQNTEKFPRFVSYAASKAAVIAFTEGLAAELKDSPIRINAVAPGSVDTPMAKRYDPSLKPGAKPKDIAEVIMYIADPTRASAIRGSVYVLPTNRRD